MTTLTDAELVDRVARARCEMDGVEAIYDLCLEKPEVEGKRRIVQAYRAEAKELLTRAGVITPAGRAELERREEEV